MLNSSDSSPSSNQIQQDLHGDRNQTIGQVYGGIVVYVSGGQAVINSGSTESAESKLSKPIGSNPYKGLLAFNEEDGDRYFGRSQEIQALWEKFRDLHSSESKIRLLPIYGPSGSGKSSLARAGLLPELGHKPLPGRARARVAVLVPGTQPLQALATVLARIAENDLTPVKKTREFAEELTIANKEKKFDGLQRIASALPDVATFPLVVLVDQFEEVYSLCEDAVERDRFIENLLYAANDRSQYVSVILTCRSDFLGETQQHPTLNKLFSTQGFLVSIMQPEELAIAISEPAKRAGHELDPATVQLLVEQTRGQQGALPLLQFALQRIWEGLEHGIEPLTTLEQIRGVGGALTHEVQQLYESLNEDEQRIARRVFVALVQIDEDNKGARRRAAITELITSESDAPHVESIIRRFAAPGVRFLVTAADEEQGETIEVAHEALIRNWNNLQEWIAECREALRQKHKIEQDAEAWERRGKPRGYLLQGRPLRDAKEFMQAHQNSRETSLSSLASELVEKSLDKQLRDVLKSLSILAIFPFLGTLLASHLLLLNKAQTLLSSEECQHNPEIPVLLQYKMLVGQRDNLEASNFCDEDLEGVDFRDSMLASANFQKSNLTNASFRNASLIYADFQQAILFRTDFTEANLEDADFQQSYFYETNLEEVNGLQESQLKNAYLCKVRLPKNFTFDPNRDCEELKSSLELE